MGYEVDFLAVGEGERSGDAIALRFGNLDGPRSEQVVVVIDGGYQDSGEKLVEHIRTYYDTEYIDLVISSHPDSDHTSGLKVVLEKLKVGCLWMHQPWNHTEDIADLFKDGRVTDNSVSRALRDSLEAAHSLEELAQSKNIPIVEPFLGVTDISRCLIVLSPTEKFYESQLPHFRGTPEPKQDSNLFREFVSDAKEVIKTIAEFWNYETLDDSGETSAENNTSTILLLAVDNQNLLFTSDAGIPALTEAADLLEKVDTFDFSTLKFIQIPHHGSRRNVGPSILNRLIGPKQKSFQKIMTAYVSASKNGAPKHPAKKVTNAFKRRGAETYATQGQTIHCFHNAPARPDWITLDPLPFYNEVEE